MITYLLAQKALCPGKIVLLRGNHEMRVQNSFPAYNPCFKASCTSVFGEALGAQVSLRPRPRPRPRCPGPFAGPAFPGELP